MSGEDSYLTEAEGWWETAAAFSPQFLGKKQGDWLPGTLEKWRSSFLAGMLPRPGLERGAVRVAGTSRPGER